jgi:glycosyltransferase involved in cell wall biosynthesis
VIVPTFNRRAKLERCLRALTLQSLPAQDFEVIVVDDGSVDDTQQFLQSLRTPFRLHCLRQNNQGAGAARRLGVERARGEYLLLINDDTVAHIDLLQEHLYIQRSRSEKNLAVLGSFEYESSARDRALTWFLSTDPFMFPQLRMKAGTTYDAPHFVTCNLSIARAAVLKAGSFDSSFRLGEDSELGLRLSRAESSVLFHPSARAWHDHLEMTMADMIGRARAYGSVYLQLLRKHPHLEVPTLFGTLRVGLTVADIEQFRATLDSRRAEVEESVKALRQYDSIDFRKYFDMPAKQGSAADMIAVLFSKAVPQVYWFFLVDTFCSLWSGQAPLTAGTELSSAGARL